MTSQPEHRDRRDHAPSEFLDADMAAYRAAYAEAARKSREAAVADRDRRPYPQRRRMRRLFRAGRLRVG